MANPADLIHWIQFHYMEDTEESSLLANDIYDAYVNSIKASSCEKKSISKSQLSTIICKLFKKAEVSTIHGYRFYKGLKPNCLEDDNCEISDIPPIAEEHGFFSMPSKELLKYAISSGQCINHNEIFKILEIKVDRTWKLLISGYEIDRSIIGLQNLTCITYRNMKILFNTVKEARICRGKSSDKDQRSSRYRIVQEWNVCGEDKIESRISSRKCSHVLPFTALSDVCCVCSSSRDSIPTESKDSISDEDMLNKLFPDASKQMINLLREQSQMCKFSKDPRGHRWEKETIRIALSLWNRSPQGYTNLRKSGIMFLPSETLLQRYKNCIQQKPGINHEMLKWLYTESNRLKAEKHGGLILDEMAVQQDLQLNVEGGKLNIEGLVDMGQACKDMHALNANTDELGMAKYILQFIFLGFDGFRFPIAYFPSLGANAPELYINVWNAISEMSQYEFQVQYVCFDGASSNRAFQLMHFENKAEAIDKNFTTVNPFCPSEKVTLIMDFSHNIKKLRNNIYASGDRDFCSRKLKLKEHFVVWVHWINAYNWDRYHNTMRVHQKLTDEHIFLTKVSKMRNHLAEETLDDDMYNLMCKYKESLKDGKHLESTIEVLDNTRHVINIFRDSRPICDLNDSRLEKLSNFENWISQWSEDIEKKEVLQTEKSKLFLSKETFSDLISMLRGFKEICKMRIEKDHKSVVPAGINSDVVENFFCQQRTICHGSITNPNVPQYKYAINSTILGQKAISKKSNAAKSTGQIHPAPFTAGPIKKKKKA